jgi:hypothetical protein
VTEFVADFFWPVESKKSEIVIQIAQLLGLEAPPMSTGSTEPRAIFVLINEQLGLGIDERLGKPELARAIVEASGETWHPDYESRGATVTKSGLIAVLVAVKFFLRPETKLRSFKSGQGNFVCLTENQVIPN